MYESLSRVLLCLSKIKISNFSFVIWCLTVTLFLSFFFRCGSKIRFSFEVVCYNLFAVSWYTFIMRHFALSNFFLFILSTQKKIFQGLQMISQKVSKDSRPFFYIEVFIKRFVSSLMRQLLTIFLI